VLYVGAGGDVGAGCGGTVAAGFGVGVGCVAGTDCGTGLVVGVGAGFFVVTAVCVGIVVAGAVITVLVALALLTWLVVADDVVAPVDAETNANNVMPVPTRKATVALRRIGVIDSGGRR